FCLQAPALLDPGELLVCDGLNADGDGARYVALRRSDGAALWHGQTTWNYERFVDDGPVAIVSDRRVHQMLNENGTTSPDSWLTGVDRRTGRELWRTPLESLAVFTLPAVGDGLVVVGSATFTWADPQVAGSPGVAGLWAWKLPRP
ncbi:MAG TPA: PQQ-binding-like beta-propeller repeat protein, partial [Candidatus Tumulicola sp.]|nr:PQQ-binding-like beta-propeller repeat protein [Candidatus Tumulicola sp.]